MSITYLKKEIQQEESNRSKIQNIVREILQNVKNKGDDAIRFYEKKFDNYSPESYRISLEEIKEAKNKLPKEVLDELNFAIQRVTTFAQKQRDSIQEFYEEMSPGIWMGQKILPVESCGCYIPAGRYPCALSPVMSVIPAKVAGVKRIVACSPPRKNGHIDPAILYSLDQMEIDEIYCIGGAQAIGAIAYGTNTIQPVDLITGPGNQYVVEAKKQVYGHVGIDFLAGPSECLIIADDTARVDFLAADILAQAEHDPNARVGLVTTSKRIGEEIFPEVEKQMKKLITHEVAAQSWRDHAEIVLAEDLESAVAYANDYASEHLEVHIENPEQILNKLTNYGALFLGEPSAEVYGDKCVGTNHILPTSGNARFTGGLWVGMYLKVVTYQKVDVDASLKLAKYTAEISKYEGMDAHRAAAQIRLDKLKEKEEND
jgi:sulfopropanediol 3-dehydrogenase